MKVFLSGASITTIPRMMECAEMCKYRLMSCHTDYLSNLERWMRVAMAKGNHTQEVMLDSGAFTAWSQGKSINVRELAKTYAGFLRKYDGHVERVWFINLDAIPGRKGGPEPTREEIAEALRASDRNFAVLSREFGDAVLPVFHQGESTSRLREVAAQAEYICVSPRNDVPERLRTIWSRTVHTYLSRMPYGNKTHGLATTGTEMATTVPWYSADSASWVHTAGYGSIVLLIKGALKRICISSTSQSRYDYGQHYDSMPPIEQQWIREEIERRGYTLHELRTAFAARASFCMRETIAWGAQIEQRQTYAATLFGV